VFPEPRQELRDLKEKEVENCSIKLATYTKFKRDFFRDLK
jgi:hypothetical protein